MTKPSKGDKTYDMYSQLCAAILNVSSGTDASCIANVIADANAWLANNKLASDVEGSSLAWEDGEWLKDQLDAYNNGELCAPPRD